MSRVSTEARFLELTNGSMRLLQYNGVKRFGMVKKMVSGGVQWSFFRFVKSGDKNLYRGKGGGGL